MDAMKAAALAVLAAASAAANAADLAHTAVREAARQAIYLTGDNFPHVAAIVTATDATYLAALKARIAKEEAVLAVAQYQ
jgi:hypothetical protein